MSILLGRTNKGKVSISPKSLQTHMHVVGATGTGKSYFLQNLARQLITARERPGLIVLDPHGDLYHQLLEYSTYLNLWHRVVLFDPKADSRYVAGYNPMQRDGRDLSFQSMMVLEACRKVWGQESFDQTPRLARWLHNSIYGAIEANLTMREAERALEPTTELYRTVMAHNVESNEMVRSDLQWLLNQKSSTIEDKIESSMSRFRRFLNNDHVSNMLTQQANILQLRQIMDEGKILLVNLKSYEAEIPEETSKLLGTLLLNDILATAFGRPMENRRPVYLMIDEFQEYATKDICPILDGGRKFGLHCILSHQHLGQLKDRDPEVYYSTMTNARTKVVFGGLLYEDAETIARETFTFDSNRIKLELNRTFFEPVESMRTSITHSHGRTTNEMLNSSMASGAVYGPDGDFFDPDLQSTSVTDTAASGSSEGETITESVAEVPFYEYHEREELSSVQFMSLEEQLYNALIQLKNQPNQCAAVKIPGRNIKFIRVPTIKDAYARDSRRRELKDYVFTETGYYSTVEEIEQEQKAREERLHAEYESITKAQDDNPTEF